MPVRPSKIITNIGEEGEKLDFSHMVIGNRKWHSQSGNNLPNFTKLNCALTLGPSNGILLRALPQRKFMFTQKLVQERL